MITDTGKDDAVRNNTHHQEKKKSLTQSRSQGQTKYDDNLQQL